MSEASGNQYSAGSGCLLSDTSLRKTQEQNVSKKLKIMWDTGDVHTSYRK
jgi:hypothetical protein